MSYQPFEQAPAQTQATPQTSAAAQMREAAAKAAVSVAEETMRFIPQMDEPIAFMVGERIAASIRALPLPADPHAAQVGALSEDEIVEAIAKTLYGGEWHMPTFDIETTDRVQRRLRSQARRALAVARQHIEAAAARELAALKERFEAYSVQTCAEYNALVVEHDALRASRDALRTALRGSDYTLDLADRLIDYFANNRTSFEGSGTPATCRAQISELRAAIRKALTQ